MRCKFPSPGNPDLGTAFSPRWAENSFDNLLWRAARASNPANLTICRVAVANSMPWHLVHLVGKQSIALRRSRKSRPKAACFMHPFSLESPGLGIEPCAGLANTIPS